MATTPSFVSNSSSYMFSTQSEALTLILDSTIHVAGGKLKGTVHVDFQEFMNNRPPEEVKVTILGTILTIFAVTGGVHSTNGRSKIDPLHETKSLWKRSSGVVPPPNSHILELPFSFWLPAHLPPSCEYRRTGRGTVGYCIKVFGKRPGSHLDTTIICPIVVVPPDPKGVMYRDKLLQWGGEMLSQTFTKSVKKTLWGDHAKILATLSLPNLGTPSCVLPLWTPIPFTLNIVTISRPMRRGSTDDQIWPAPPLSMQDVQLQLFRDVTLQADGFDAKGSDLVAYLGGSGPPASSRRQQMHVQMKTAQMVWEPIHTTNVSTFSRASHTPNEKGTWRQEVTFNSKFTLKCGPTFDASIMKVSYHLSLKVAVAGFHNDLTGDCPVRIVSPLPPPDADEQWAGDELELELPSTYKSSLDWTHDIAL